ncbi:Aminotriazole resistance protein [Pyrenophora tritici-repentis]|nr:Aminotriazole resistance protein [Pyrenophora tritici-repentis]
MLLRKLQALPDRTAGGSPYYILAVVHRRVLLFGTVFFALFNLVCALSSTFIGLVVAKAFQGIGAAFTIPSAQAHIALHFTDPARKAKALGIWSAAGSLGFIIGLILGGVLTAFLGWRFIFYVSVIISGIVIPAAYVLLPRVRSPRAATPPPVDGSNTSESAAAPKKALLQSVRERLFIVGWALSIPGILLFSFITEHSSYWRYNFPGMILYIAGIGAVYITANFVVVSSAFRSDHGAAAGVFNVALQVGGSVLGLAVLMAVAEGIEKKYGDANLPQGELSGIGYKSVYYSCVILSGIGLFLSVFAIQVPDSMRGSLWKKPEASAPTETSSSYELHPTQSRQS